MYLVINSKMSKNFLINLETSLLNSTKIVESDSSMTLALILYLQEMEWNENGLKKWKWKWNVM